MSTNDDEEKDEVLDEQASEDLLKDAKYPEVEEETPAENDTAAEESEDEGDQIAESEQSEFTKKYDNIKGDTPEEYAKNLEVAYDNSFAELQKLRHQPAPIPKAEEESQEETDAKPATWTDLYAQQKLQEEADKAYKDLTETYPQAADQQSTQYQQFVKEVDTLSRTILASQGRLAPPAELYSKAAVILGWESQTADDKLRAKLKEDGSTSKNPSATRKPSTSKVSDEEVGMYKKMNPMTEKTDAEIRVELELVK